MLVSSPGMRSPEGLDGRDELLFSAVVGDGGASVGFASAGRCGVLFCEGGGVRSAMADEGMGCRVKEC